MTLTPDEAETTRDPNAMEFRIRRGRPFYDGPSPMSIIRYLRDRCTIVMTPAKPVVDSNPQYNVSIEAYDGKGDVNVSHSSYWTALRLGIGAYYQSRIEDFPESAWTGQDKTARDKSFWLAEYPLTIGALAAHSSVTFMDTAQDLGQSETNSVDEALAQYITGI